MKRVQRKAIRIIVDVAEELLNRGLKHRPFLIKPNHHELDDLFGVRIDALQDAFPYARQLQAMGAQNVLVSMGASGALLIGEDGREYVCAAAQGAFSETLAEAAGVAALRAELNEEKRDPWGSALQISFLCAYLRCASVSCNERRICPCLPMTVCA